MYRWEMGVQLMKRCSNCYKTKPLSEFSLDKRYRIGVVSWCKVCHVKAVVTYKDKYPEKARQVIRNYKTKNRNKVNCWEKERRFRIKTEMVTAYGGQCACCSENKIEFLTIDHINGGGTQHRKQIKKSGGTDFYLWLKKMGWPRQDYQLLCWNCNCATKSGIKCQHKTDSNLKGL